METSQVEGKAVALINCRVKTGKFDSSLEVVIMSSYIEVEISPKKFPIESATATSLEVNTISVNQLINVSVKVSKVSNPSQVTSKEWCYGKVM